MKQCQLPGRLKAQATVGTGDTVVREGVWHSLSLEVTVTDLNFDLTATFLFRFQKRPWSGRGRSAFSFLLFLPNVSNKPTGAGRPTADGRRHGSSLCFQDTRRESRVPLPQTNPTFLVALAVCPQHVPFAIWSFRLAWCLGSYLSREGKDRS